MKIMKKFIEFLMSLDGIARFEIIFPLIMGLIFLFIPGLGWALAAFCLVSFVISIGQNS